MGLTLKLLQTEMHDSFAKVSLRIDNLDINVNERIDTLLLRLDKHIKETAFRFREVDRRFDAIDERFDRMDQRLDRMDQRLDKMDQRLDKMDQRLDKMDQRLDKMDGKLNRITADILEALSPYFFHTDNMVDDHEKRICILETKH